MKPVHTFNVVPSLPGALEKLRDLAYNLRWSWNHETIALFRRLDSDLWEKTFHNPVLMLGMIDQARLEAAAIDGASRLSRFRHVTLPLLTPTIFFNLILSVINTFQTFTNAFVATDGGPLDATLFFVLYMYKQAFELLNMGYASALAWILFLVVLLLTLLILRTQRSWVFYAGEISDD